MSETMNSLFFESGKIIDVPTSYRILLHHVDHCFFLEEGELDIFVLHTVEEEQEIHEKFFLEMSQNDNLFLGDVIPGSLSFLINIKAGQCLFPFPFPVNQSIVKVIALATTKVKLRKLPLSIIKQKVLQSKKFENFFFNEIKEWLNSIATIFSTSHSTHIDQYIDPGMEVELHKNKTLAISKKYSLENKHATIWLRHKSGKLNLMQKKNIVLTGNFFPLTQDNWLGCIEDTHIQALLEEQWLENWDSIMLGILNFHQLIIEVVVGNLSKRVEKEKVLIELKQKQDRNLLQETFRIMGSLLEKDLAPIPPQSHDPLLRACQLIGNIQQQIFTYPSRSVAHNTQEKLYEISVASGIYYRMVLLSDKWWQGDHGPLLGFLNEKKMRPIALIPKKPGVYQIIDPDTKLTEEINQKNSQDVISNAVMFYRNFPAKDVLTSKDVFNFCLHGKRKELISIFFASFLGIFISLFIPFAYKVLFDTIIPSLDTPLLLQLVIGLAVVSVSTAIFSMTREYSVLRLESLLDHDLEMALWIRLLSLPVNFFRKFTVGNLMQRISSISQIRTTVSGQMIRGMINAIFSTIYLLAMLYYSPILTLVGISILLIAFIITIFSFLRTQPLEKKRQDIQGVLNGKVIQIIMGLSKIRTNGVENRIFSYWAQKSILSKKLNLKIGNIKNFVDISNNTFNAMTTLAIFYVIMQMMGSGTTGTFAFLSIGTYLAFNAAFVSFSQALLEFSHILMDMLSIYPMWLRGSVILKEPAEISMEKINPGKLRGEVQVDHVFFRYDKSSPLVTENLSFYAAPGEFIGIVGPSGCGKSTLVRLLLGFEVPHQGAIYYDGKDLSHLDLREVRNQLGVILQNSTTMDGTIRENITGGSIASDEEVMQAVRMAGLESDIKSFPMGIRTVLTTGGATLSGGQRQRILIARALLNKSSILILDEATNALDNKTQEIVTQNLQRLEVTRIVIAHRLSTIRHANRIYVMDKGKVVDSGTFKELASRPGMFTELLERQKL